MNDRKRKFIYNFQLFLKSLHGEFLPATRRFNSITNRCNVGCMKCCFYSPLRIEIVGPEWEKQQMEFGTFKQIIDELKVLGEKTVYFLEFLYIANQISKKLKS